MVPQEVVRLALLDTVVLPVLDIAPLEVVNFALLDVQTFFIFLPDLSFESSQHRCKFFRSVVSAAPALSGAPCLNLRRLVVLDGRDRNCQ